MTATLNTPHGEVTVRAALAGDAARLRALRLEALSAHPQAFAADPAKTAAEPESAWAERIEALASDQSGLMCLAESGRELIGMAGLGRGHWPKTRHSAVIWGVYVNAAWRGLRIGEALIEELAGWARAHGVSVLKLAVVSGNSAAVRCYARCGFSIYGLEPSVIQVDGVYYDELLMARIIA